MLTTIQAVALVVLGVALTFFLTVWFTRDDPGSFNEVDIGFLADMTTHHQGAISLGFAYLPVENDSIVGHTAREVILAQTTEISTMNRFLGEAGDDAVRAFAEKIAHIQRIEISELNDRRELLGLAPIDVNTTSGHGSTREQSEH